MALVKYIGPSAAVYVPLAGQQCAKSSSIEVTEEIAAALLMTPTDWEGGDEATKALAPKFPSPVAAVSGFAGPFDATRVYTSGVIVEEGGMLYLSVKASVGETPRLALHVWQCLGPIAPSGLPGIMVPILSLGSPIGSSVFIPPPLTLSLSRLIVPKTGVLNDIAVYNASTAKGKIAVALYDTGQANNGEYTRLGQSAPVTQGEHWQYQSLGDLGKPPLVAGQHVIAAVIAETGGTEFASTFPGPLEKLPEGYLPGRVLGKLAGTREVGSMAFPEKLTNAQFAVVANAVHVIASIT